MAATATFEGKVMKQMKRRNRDTSGSGIAGTQHSRARLMAIAVAVTVGGLLSVPAEFMGIGAGGMALGATRTWTGAGIDANWDTGANWGGTAPITDDDVTFAGTTRLTNVNNRAAGILASVKNVVFNAGGFVITGNALRLNGDSNFTNTAGDNNWGIAITLSEDAKTFTSSAGNLTLSGNITSTKTATAVTVASVGNTVISGVLGTGIGALTKSGTGTLILSNANTYSGTTTISGGSLHVGDGGTTGTLGTSTSTINNNGNLTANRSNAITFGQIIGGTGSFTQAGTGTTTLTNVNTYTGATTIQRGTLQIDGSLGSSAVNVETSGTLAGSGALSGIATVKSGGTIAPGSGESSRTLTTAARMIWQGGSTYEFDMAAATGTAGVAYDTITGTGRVRRIWI